MANITMTDSQQVDIGPVTAVDKAGNPAPLDGTPEFTVSDESILTVVVDENDPTMAMVVTVGALGTAQLVVKADADLGEGVVEVIGTVDFTIVAGQAVSINVAVGTPTEKP